MANCCSPRTAFIIRVIYTSFGIFVGIAVCFVFVGVFGNKHAGFWGLASAVLAALCLVQASYLYVKMECVHKKPNVRLMCLFGILGIIGTAFGLGGFAAYLGLGIIDSIHHQVGSLPRSHYVVCVWCFANFKWGLTLFFYSLKSFKFIYKSSLYNRMDEEIASTNIQDDSGEALEVKDNT